jgi:phage baseplate assembly protein W|tara:strand:- start:3791 stop:4207 length:417 start_codon:yes stop_codon:yes gene_type:complete
MAFIISSKFPVDTLPDVAVGVSIPFSGKAVFNQTYITKDQIKSNLINFFLTNKGERYLNPGFGGNLRATLFEAISTNVLDSLESQVRDQLEVLFPTLSIQELNVDSYPDENLISITLKYKVLNQSLDEIQINFNNDGI